VSYGFCFLFCFCCVSLTYDPNVRVFKNILPTRVHADETRRRPRRVVTGARASSSWRPDSAREEARDGARRRGGSLARCDDDERTGARDGTTGRRACERGRVEAIFDRFWRPRRREKDRSNERFPNERTVWDDDPMRARRKCDHHRNRVLFARLTTTFRTNPVRDRGGGSRVVFQASRGLRRVLAPQKRVQERERDRG